MSTYPHSLSVALTVAALVGTPLSSVDARDENGVVVSRVTAQDGRMVHQTGKQYIWGMNDDAASLPIINLPPGALKVRLRFRADEFARAFVKMNDGSVRQYFLICPHHGLCTTLSLGNETARNVKYPAPNLT